MLKERLRQALDLEDWAAFAKSFAAMMELLGALGSGQHGPAPRTISLLSGDIHFSYRALLQFPPELGVQSRINQLVSSPIRNALAGRDRHVLAFASSGIGRRVGHLLRRSVRVPPGEVSWELEQGPFFANEMSQLTLTEEGERLRVRLPKLDIAVQGTGDTVAALFFFHLLRTGTLATAIEVAASSMFGVLERTQAVKAKEMLLVEAQEEFISPSRNFRAEPVEG